MSKIDRLTRLKRIADTFDVDAFMAALRTSPTNQAMEEFDGSLRIDWSGEREQLIQAVVAAYQGIDSGKEKAEA